MKRSILFLAVLSTQLILAQDKIYVKGGKVIDAKVVEISPDEVLYKSMGETYALNRSDVNSIIYLNGTTDHFSSETISGPENGEEPQTRIVNGYNTAPEGSVAQSPNDNSVGQPTPEQKKKEGVFVCRNDEVADIILFGAWNALRIGQGIKCLSRTARAVSNIRFSW